MADQITLPIRCATCGGAVILEMAGWQTVPPGETRNALLVTQTYACPNCKRTHAITLPGTISAIKNGPGQRLH
jgi:hypothetical protein